MLPSFQFLTLGISLLVGGVQAYGDRLNRTMCYCGTPQADPVVQAYYYRMDYFNVHLQRDFSISWTCHSDECREKFLQHEKHCGRFERSDDEQKRKTRWAKKHGAHEFCYVRNSGFNDRITFDGQKRGLPSTVGEALPSVVNAVCGPVCADYFGLSMLQMDSHIDSYDGLDDMCDGCK